MLIALCPVWTPPLLGTKDRIHIPTGCVYAVLTTTLKRKNISHCQLCTLPEQVSGTLSPTAEPQLLQSWRTCVYFGHCCFFTLDEVFVPSQAAHVLCCEGLCTQLVDHIDCQDSWNVNFPSSVRIPMTGYIPHLLCMQGLVNPSIWNSLVKLHLAVYLYLSQQCCCL